MTTETTRYERMVREWVLGKLGRTFKEGAGRLKFPFVDPGGGYEGNLWDWDSFWAVYATLNLLDKDGHLAGKSKADTGRPWLDYAEGNIANFFDHQEKDGYLPPCFLTWLKEEAYEIVKHREGVIHNMHKPFTGEPVMNGDFVNWNVLALNMADELRGKPSMEDLICN